MVLDEPQLFIARQAAADVMWDCVRVPPVLVPGVPPFINAALRAGVLAASVTAAAHRIAAMREQGLL